MHRARERQAAFDLDALGRREEESLVDFHGKETGELSPGRTNPSGCAN